MQELDRMLEEECMSDYEEKQQQKKAKQAKNLERAASTSFRIRAA